MQHQSRFKAYLIDPRSLRQESRELAPALLEIRHQLSLQKISEPEAALLFLMSYLEKRAPQKWWIKRDHHHFQVNSSFPLYSLSETFSFLKSNNTLSEWLKGFDFKKLPAAVLNAIRGWMLGTHRLRLVESPITPYEMLECQAKGERVVTLSFENALSGDLVDGRRDAFEFLLHDLIHADLMFANPSEKKAQIDFFRSLTRVFDEGLLSVELANDVSFRTSIEYLISDMNSHTHHMAHLLKASYISHLTLEAQKRDLDEASQQRLREKLELLQRVGEFSPDVTQI